MCGRLACGLEPKDICSACCYKAKGRDNFTRPQWKNISNAGLTYKPSYNICPKEVAPVLISGTHFESNERVVAPMIFGVIPQWSEVSEKRKFSTINCRIETIKSSKLYGNLLSKGQRCVVVCHGFYEWKKENKNKKPYFIHVKQPENVVMGDPDTWNVQFTEEKGSTGVRMLRLAGLFERNHSHTIDETTLSFTIITKTASSNMLWLHDRMPVTLETEQQIDAWLNRDVDGDQALACLSMRDDFIYYPVSGVVSFFVNKDVSCIKRESEPDSKKSSNKSANLMQNWLQKGQKRTREETDVEIGQKEKKEKKTEEPKVREKTFNCQWWALRTSHQFLAILISILFLFRKAEVGEAKPNNTGPQSNNLDNYSQRSRTHYKNKH